MTCTRYSFGDGTSAFVCSCGHRRQEPRRYCVVCLRDGRRTPAALLCDHPKPGGGTCDAGLCPAHTNRVRVGIDWCPAHSEAPKP